MDIEEIWPPFALRITTGAMEMTPTRESDVPELAEIARGGVRRDGVEAFLVDWDSGSDEEIGRSIAQYQWGTRANFSPSDWTIEFTVRVGGRIIGLQGISSSNFLKTRSVKTGSWLARDEQGQGSGTRMRRALVTAFADHFGARTFHTGYIEGNHASRRVSEKIGYSPNGDFTIVVQGGEARAEHQMILRAEDIVRDDSIDVVGVEVVRRFLGLDPQAKSSSHTTAGAN